MTNITNDAKMALKYTVIKENVRSVCNKAMW